MREVWFRKPVSYLLVLSMWIAFVALIPSNGAAQQSESTSADNSKNSKSKTDKTTDRHIDRSFINTARAAKREGEKNLNSSYSSSALVETFTTSTCAAA